MSTSRSKKSNLGTERVDGRGQQPYLKRKHDQKVESDIQDDLRESSIDEEEDEPEQPDNTQSTSGTNLALEELLGKMVNDQQQRHAKKKEKVYRAYDASHAELRAAITTVFDEHEDKASDAHRAQMRRLRELTVQKEKIEVQMASQLEVMRRNYDAHSRDLEGALRSRLEQLRGV